MQIPPKPPPGHYLLVTEGDKHLAGMKKPGDLFWEPAEKAWRHTERWYCAFLPEVIYARPIPKSKA